MTDRAYLCSCEFQDMVNAINKSTTIRIALQLMRIPVTKEYKEFYCGKGACKDFKTSVVETAQQEQADREKREAPFSEKDLQLPVSVSPPAPGSEPRSEPMPNAKPTQARRGGRAIQNMLPRTSKPSFPFSPPSF
jgi:hypothetical protein